MQQFLGCILLVLLQVVISSAQDKPAATTQPSAAAPLPVVIQPSDPRLYLIGRFDLTDAAGPRCQWSHAQVRIRFRGTDLQARMKTEEKSFFQVEIDGQPTSILHPGKGVYLLDLATNLPAGDHEVAICKRTEAHTGIVQFLGFYLNAGGEVLQPRRMTRLIEVVGDTVVSGYGNESKVPSEGYVPEHQNACMSFGPIAGRELHAEVSVTSWPLYSELISKYDQALPFQPQIKWQFTPQPDAIVVMGWIFAFNMGDSTRTDTFMGQYKPFVQEIRKHNPQAVIYLATSPVVADGYPKGVDSFKKMREALQKLEADLAAEGDAGIRYLEFASQESRDGFGGDYCPTVRTHKKMAKKLIEVLKEDLNWQDDPAAKPEP